MSAPTDLWTLSQRGLSEMKISAALVSLFVFSSLGLAATPQKKTIELPEDNAMAKLKPGPGLEKVRAYCSVCHSTDYIVRQPQLDAEHWQSEVKKMIEVYGAPVTEEDAKAITEYLISAYGIQAPKKASGKSDK
jgi:sulfite dehydrogenase (cytochrome) subunit B